MKRKNNNDILDMVSAFKKEVLERRISPQEIVEEVRMMNFKVRPVQGDISILDMKNTHFIKVLWRLGKLDEFFQEHIKKVSAKHRDLFFTIFQDMFDKYQEELNDISLKQERIPELSSTLEMEIFKDPSSKYN